jgi:uncharacterized protein (TIGR02246 family)
MTPDEQAIHNILAQYEACWNRSDSRAISALFAEDANFIHIYGGQLDGRSDIEASHRIIFDTIYKNSRAALTVRRIRFLRPDIAVAFTGGRVAFQENGEAREIDSRPTMIVAKEDGAWQVVAFQNTRVSEIPAAAHAAAAIAT